MAGPLVVICRNCGAQGPSPCPFCGAIDISEQQRQVDERAQSIRNWETPRYYVRRGVGTAGPFTANQIRELAASGDHYSEISDNGAPFVRIMYSPFAQYVPPPKKGLSGLWIFGGLFLLIMLAGSCAMCTLTATL